MNTNIISTKIEPLRQELLHHSLYSKIQTIEDLHVFLTHHVYAVWDFMSLLKGLQIHLTSVSIPWTASPNPELRYLINEIVVAEESDLALDGSRQSHFEMYLDAMKECGATTQPVLDFLEQVAITKNVFVAIKNSHLPTEVKDFLYFSFTVIETGQPHKIASAFTFGREDLIPNMFTEIVKSFQKNFPETNVSKLIYYFERHIELDADEHGPMAMKMIDYLCGDDLKKWQDVEQVAQEALEKRIGLWNAIERLVVPELV
jgi:hypothetical protein